MQLVQKTTRRPAEERKTDIVGVVLGMAAQRSPHDITTTDIAVALGLTQGAVFKHFPTKEAIWLAVMDWVEANLLSTLRRAEQSAPTPLAGIYALFMAHARFVAEHPGVPRLIFHELQQPDDTPVKRRVRGMLVAYRGILARLLHGAEADGGLRPGLDKDATAVLFIGSIQGLVMQSLLTGSTDRLVADGERVIALLLGAITRPESA